MTKAVVDEAYVIDLAKRLCAEHKEAGWKLQIRTDNGGKRLNGIEIVSLPDGRGPPGFTRRIASRRGRLEKPLGIQIERVRGYGYDSVFYPGMGSADLEKLSIGFSEALAATVRFADAEVDRDRRRVVAAEVRGDGVDVHVEADGYSVAVEVKTEEDLRNVVAGIRSFRATRGS